MEVEIQGATINAVCRAHSLDEALCPGRRFRGAGVLLSTRRGASA